MRLGAGEGAWLALAWLRPALRSLRAIRPADRGPAVRDGGGAAKGVAEGAGLVLVHEAFQGGVPPYGV